MTTRFDVRAVDGAGKVDPTPESYTWTIEAPPTLPAIEISIDSGPPSPTESTTARFTFSASVPAARFECALDGAAFAMCTSSITCVDLAVGDHTFGVRAVDSAGITDAAQYTWTIVAPPPCPAPVTVVADADAWLDENSSSTNKGDDSILKVQSKAPKDNFRALLHFPLPSVAAGCAVETAVLSLYVSSSASDRALQAYRLAGGWSERTATWAKPVADDGPTRGHDLGQRLSRVAGHRDGAGDVHERLRPRLPFARPRGWRGPGAAVPQPREGRIAADSRAHVRSGRTVTAQSRPFLQLICGLSAAL